MMPRRKRRLASRIRDGVRQLLAFLFTNVGVIVMVVAYTIAGAFMFQAIEGASEMERVNHMARERDNTAQYLWQNVTMVFNPLNETAMKHRISIELHQYQRKIVVAVRRGWDGGRSNRQWSFSSAFLYSLTVITTIGYGHLSPRTSWGKITTILYALLGMPLFLLYLSNVGELLARWFKCIYALACLCRGCPGFTRRRVARMRTQLEISEEESIERPEGWRLRQIDMASENRPNSRYPPSHCPYPRHLPSGYHERDADLRYPPDSRYPEARFPPDPRYPEARFPPDSRYPEPRFPPDSRYPESRFPPDPRYSEARFAPDPRYPEAKFPLDPRYPEARSPPNRYFQDPRIPTARLPPRCPQDSRYYPSTRTVPDSRYPESRFSPREVPDSRYALDSRYPPHPNKYFQRRPDYFRSASMPQPWESARRPEVRGWSEPAPYRSESSEFSYVTFDAQTITVPLSVCVSIMVGYLMFGSMLFGMWESWDQLDGAYFCFISLTSIGFGDFVPGERVYTARIETSFIVCSLYLMLGMALVAMCFNLMQEQVIHYCAGLKRAIKRMCRCRCKR